MTWNDMAFDIVWKWLRAYDNKGLGDFIPEDELMQDLKKRIANKLEEVYWYGYDTNICNRA